MEGSAGRLMLAKPRRSPGVPGHCGGRPAGLYQGVAVLLDATICHGDTQAGLGVSQLWTP